jgi:bacterioferritin-associated ferredoxin
MPPRLRYHDLVDRLLCHCMLVGEREVIHSIRTGARTVDEVGERCEAGTGCGSCRGGISLLLAKEADRRRLGHNHGDDLLAQLLLFGEASGVRGK